MNTLSLSSMGLFLAACAGQGPDSEPPADTDAHTDTDADTAVGLLYDVAAWRTDGGAYVDGHRGQELVDKAGTTVCVAFAAFVDRGGAVPGGCPSCAWAFNLGLEGGEAAGAACASAGMEPAAYAGWEGAVGFAETFEYDYNGTVVSLPQPALWYYVAPYGWELGASGDSGATLSGDPEAVELRAFYGYRYFYP